MIEIDIGPNLVSLGTFVISWHGFFSFVAVATAIYLVGRWALMRGIDPDDIYSIAVWAIIGGIIGARIVHVVDNWSFYQSNQGQIIAIWSGGIGIWGAILGGLFAGVGSIVVMNRLRANRRPALQRAVKRADSEEARRKAEAELARNQHLPIGAIADLTAPALLIVQTIGRLGDIVNGEHCAKAADFFLGFIWTNPVSPASGCDNGVGVSVHPVIAYEMVWNMIALAIVWRLRGRLRPDGMLFALYLALYSVGRFAITFAREDNVWALGLQEAQYIALVVLAITIPLLVVKGTFASAAEALDAPSAAVQPRGTRAERRRRR
jgi:phosphatidylglycerol:prolipoprotein diacylglycerol transferase